MGSQAQQDTSWTPKPPPASLCPRPCHFQGMRRMASSSMRTDCWGKGTFCEDELLCVLEANTAVVARCLRHIHRLRLKERQPQHSKKAA